jgi:hypothetical protein
MPVITFFAAYIILSVLWLQVRDIYGYGTTFVGSKLAAGAKDARLEEITIGENVVTAGFSSMKRADIYVDVPVNLSVYTTNVPLTLSLLFSLYTFIKRRMRAYSEAILILLMFHILYVFLFVILQLTNTFMMKGIEGTGLIRLSNYHFLWGLAEHASMSFAPFLIVVYIFVRFRR